jgi:hypothetical protein
MTSSWPRIAVSTLALAASFGVGVTVGRSGQGDVGAPLVAPLTADAAQACQPSAEDLRIACIPFMRDGTNSLQEAKTKVEALAVQVREKETEVERLEAQVATRATLQSDLSVRLEQARAELVGLQGQLQEALAAKAQADGKLGAAESQLARTQSELTTEKRRTKEALDEAAFQRWAAFVNDSQLSLCREGNRERLTACRDAVERSLAPMEGDYTSCVRSGQATPELKQAVSGEDLPAFGKYVDQTNPSTRDWYILFCDPELPEAAGGGGGGRMKPIEDPRYFRERAQRQLDGAAQQVLDTQVAEPPAPTATP